MQPLRTKKIIQPLGTKKNHATPRDKKMTQPLGPKKSCNRTGKKNHALNRFCQTFGSSVFFFPVFAHFFARFCPFFAPFLPKNAPFCLFLPSFARLARFVWFRPNSQGFIQIRSSPVCLVLGIPGLNQSIRLKIAPNGKKIVQIGPNMLL